MDGGRRSRTEVRREEKDASAENRQSFEAYRGRNAAKGIQPRIVARFACLILAGYRSPPFHIGFENRLPQSSEGHSMTLAEEYRHFAEEFFRHAREAKTEEERKRFLNMAIFWSQAAARENGNQWVGTCALEQ
jgi:hypothetical protein